MIRGLSVNLVAKIPEQAQEWRNDERIRKWCRQFTLISESRQQCWLDYQERESSVQMFGIVNNKSNDFLGVCGLTSIDLINRKAEFSIYIGPEHQNKGYAYQALGLLFGHGFTDFGLHRIWGETFDGNPARKLFDKLGMKHEGRLKHAYFRGGEWIDSHIYAIVKE